MWLLRGGESSRLPLPPAVEGLYAFEHSRASCVELLSPGVGASAQRCASAALDALPLYLKTATAFRWISHKTSTTVPCCRPWNPHRFRPLLAATPALPADAWERVWRPVRAGVDAADEPCLLD